MSVEETNQEQKAEAHANTPLLSPWMKSNTVMVLPLRLVNFSTGRGCEQLPKGSYRCLFFAIPLSFGSVGPLSYQASETLCFFWSSVCHLQKMRFSLAVSSVYLSWKLMNSWAHHFLLCFDGWWLLTWWATADFEECLTRLYVHPLKSGSKTPELKLICKNDGFSTFLSLILNITIYFQKYSIIGKLIKLFQWLTKKPTAMCP